MFQETPIQGDTDIWLTPPDLIRSLGDFDLDPCAAPEPRPWDTAKEHYPKHGLQKPWYGRVWLNPPYGQQIGLWLERLAAHGNGIALVFARTETKWFIANIWERATGVHFIYKRIRFCYPNGEQAGIPAAPSVLVAYGKQNVEAFKTCNRPGKIVCL